MDANVERALRLIEALETLAAECEVGARSGTPGVAALQKRAAPLVADLARLSKIPSVSALRPRVGALIIRQQASTAAMAERLGSIRQRLAALNESKLRLKRMAPAYAAALQRSSRFTRCV